MKRFRVIWQGPRTRLLCVLAGTALSAPAQPVEFTGLQHLSNREAVLKFNGPTGQVYRIDVSTNLTSWVAMVSFPFTNTSLQHTDTAAPFLSERFYVARQWSGSNLVTGDHLPTPDGDVIIRPIYHASLALSWSNKMIYVDPANNSYGGLPKADLILFTHNHSDHFNAGSTSGFTNSGATIIAPQNVFSALSADLKSLTLVLTNGMSTNRMGVGIEAMPAYNLANTPHSKGPNNGYVLTIGGQRIYIAGDTEDTAEMRALPDIHVAFLPINQPYTMTASQAVSAVRAFCPRVVYPYHYRNADSSFTDLNGFKQQVMTNPGTEVRLRKWY